MPIAIKVRTAILKRPAKLARRSLRRGTAWVVFGQGVFAASQWAALIVLARLGGPEAVGRYAFALAVTAPIVLFSQLGLRHILATDTTSENSFAEYLGVRLGTLGLASLAILALSSTYPTETALVVLAVALAKIVDGVSNIFHGLMQRREQFASIGCSLALRGAAGLAGLTLGMLTTQRLIGGLLGLAAGWLLVWCLFDCVAARPWRTTAARDRARPLSQLQRVARLALVGLPLGIASMLVALNTNLPRYFVQHYLGDEQLGLFAGMAYLVVAGDMIANATGQSVSPRLAREFMEGRIGRLDRLLLSAEGIAAGFAVIALIAVVAGGQQLLTAVYGASYAQQTDVLAWIMVAGVLVATLTPVNYALTAVRALRWQPALLLIGLAINALGCLMLIPTHGLVGAAGAWSGALLVQLLCSFWVLRSVLRRRTARMLACSADRSASVSWRSAVE